MRPHEIDDRGEVEEREALATGDVLDAAAQAPIRLRPSAYDERVVVTHGTPQNIPW